MPLSEVEYSKGGLAINSIMFFMDRAEIRRRIPPMSTKSDTLLIRIFNLDGNIPKSSIKINIPKDSGFYITPWQNATRSQSSIKSEGSHNRTLHMFYSIEFEIHRQSAAIQDTVIDGLSLVYTTPSMRWSATYEFELDTRNSTAVLYTKAKLHNYGVETWDQCKMAISSRQAPNYPIQEVSATGLQTTTTDGPWQPRGIMRPSMNEDMHTRHVHHVQLYYPQADASCQCLRGKVGFDTIWELPNLQGFFPGANLLQRPISCTRFEKMKASRQTSYGSNYLCIEAKPAPFLFPGELEVKLNHEFVGWTQLRKHFPGETMMFTCMMVPKTRIDPTQYQGSGWQGYRTTIR
ncbi:hypothetical protein BGZ63DRAFT_172346 [Mariannaea sp. PMI_226]|nr:hypothetical protein BGZ63DRAFT_172346 [Mariannaea sp. PMI_226]